LAAGTVCASQYRHPALALAKYPSSHFCSLLTQPPFSMKARLRWLNALAISGRRCIVSTLFGAKPRVSMKTFATPATSREWSAGRGVTSGG
jgi:hypothetical protein